MNFLAKRLAAGCGHYTMKTPAWFRSRVGTSLALLVLLGGTPLACAAANASLDLFEREPRLREIVRERLRPADAGAMHVLLATATPGRPA